MRFLVALTLFSFNLFAQVETKLFHGQYVEAYYDKDTKQPIYIFESINGKIVDTLENIDNEYAWYKIAIKDSDYGWLKIKNIQRLPSANTDYGYEDYWVKNVGFLIAAENYDENQSVYLYDEPSTASNRIHKTDNFQIVNISEVSDLWAKVNLVVGKKKVSGWLSYSDQCPYPWTTCPKHE